jgi:hypothetical protein
MYTTRIHRPVSGIVGQQKAFFLPLCLIALCSAGCATQRHPKFHLADASLARPIVPTVAPDNSAASLSLPDIDTSAAVLPPSLATTHSLPTKPHTSPNPAVEPPPAAKPSAPSLAPELTAEELSIAKNDTQRSLDVATRNLTLTQGKRLNPAQNDLASKVRGFAESAREAVRDGDWSRAKSLAKKAEVLSQELAESL